MAKLPPPELPKITAADLPKTGAIDERTKNGTFASILVAVIMTLVDAFFPEFTARLTPGFESQLVALVGFLVSYYKPRTPNGTVQ